MLEQDRMFVSNDIYNNVIRNVHDNAIEADGMMYNGRILRNFCVDGASSALSSQTLYGGPVYFIRNIIYHSSSSGFVKHQSNPSGSHYYHNTSISKVMAGLGSNYHFRNNLILDWLPEEPIFSAETFTNYTSSDYNGFLPQSEGIVFICMEFTAVGNNERLCQPTGRTKIYRFGTIPRGFRARCA